MPRLLEADAEFLTLNYDTLAPDKQAEAKDWLQRYKQQQADEGEPLFPSVVTRQVEQENNLRRMFEAPDKIDYDPGYTSADPMHDKMQHANMALLASRYQKEPAEVASRYDYLINDYARQKLGASEDVDTAKFYALAQKDMQRVKLREDTQREGMSAALRGEDGVKALAAWQAKNADRAKDDAGLFMRGYQQALEQDGEMLPIADRLLKALESGTDKTGQNVQANMERGQVRQELGQMVEQLAGMKKAQRKSVYRSIAARIEAAGYDQKGFWSQMLGFLDQQLYRAETTLSETSGIASDVASNFPAMLAEGMTGNRDFGITPSETAQTDASVARRKSIGNVQQEIMQIVSGELDPVKPVTGWMNETIETGLIKGPGAVAPFMAASALLGPYGAGVVFTADFAAQNRRELVQSGLDDEQAQKIAVMAAPLQAAVESLSNMVSLGKFPAVQAALPRFTRPVGGASLVGRYVQNSLISGATEFTEEQIQDNLVVPAMQELLGALEKDVPEVDWSFYKTRAANTTPELAATLLPMALVFGGVMTAADARLSDRMTSNIDALTALNYSQAQATEIVQEKTPEARIAKAASLWRSRAGNKTSLEKGAAKLAERLKALSGDAVAYQAELERRGVLPRVMHTAENDWLLTFNDGSTARFGTHDEASTARWTWAEDQLGRVHALTREALSSMERNMSTNRELGVEFKPDVRMVEAGQATPDIQRRVEQGKVLGDIDPNEAFDTASMVDRATAEADGFLSSYQILGSSRNEFKDGVLRTTIKLWEGSNVLTLVEEKLEGDAKAIVASRGGRGWMLAALRNYEQESGDKVFREVPDDQLTDDDLVEAWSHLGQSYLVGRSSFGEPLQQNNMRRFSRLLMRAGLAGALNSESTFWQAVVNRAQKLGELKAAGKLNEDVVAELEKQLGIDSQVKHEQGAMQEAQNVANEVAQEASDWVDDSEFAGQVESSETFSISSKELRSKIDSSPDLTTLGELGITEGFHANHGEEFIPDFAPRASKQGRKGQYAGFYLGPALDEVRQYGQNVTTFPLNPNMPVKILRRPGQVERITPEMIKEWRDEGVGVVVGPAIISSRIEIATLSPSVLSGETFSLRVTPAQDAEYMRAVESGDMETAQRMVDAAARAAGYDIGPMFHGGADGFNVFSFEKMGEQGTSEGMGFYFTNQEQVARGYVKEQGGRLMRVWLKKGKRLNSKKITINRAQLAKVLKKIDPKGDDFLTNYGDVGYEGYSKVLNDAVSNLLDYSSSDVDLIGGLINSGASPRQLYRIIEEITGKSGMVTTAEDGGWGESGHVITVITAPEYVKLADPVTRDESGNVIPLSQRFNPADDRITYSIRPGDFASRAIPADSSKVVQMPDGARLVGPTTFSIRAYHGTPHKVDRFRTDKIGTGEGAQAYGWGLYFAESPKVAEMYAKQLQNKVDPRAAAERLWDHVVAERPGPNGTAYVAGGSFTKARFIKAFESGLLDAALVTGTTAPDAYASNLYTVELLPDADEFLDWDKPLSEQSEKVKAAIQPFTKNLGDDIFPTGGALYSQFIAEPRGEQKASEKLASLGIPGIRYLDQGSRGAGDGTRNYVIFDENLVRILEENGKPVAQDTFSLRPGDFASRVEAMFSPFQRSPEARLIMTRVAKSRALKLGQQVFEASIRTIGSIDREARVRAALAEDKAVQDYLDGLTPAARQTLEWQPADLQDDPLVAAMLDYGKLMSKTTALQRGKVDLKMGDFDGAPWLPPSFYSKGAGIMPDQMAQAMFDAGLLPDAYTDTLWSELSKRIEATRKDKAAHREAVQAFKDAKKAARDAASKEADKWADNAKKQAGSGKAQRDRIKAWIKLHDAILAAIPAIIRHEVGSFAQVADYATDEAAMRFLESRVAKMDKVLEKYLKKDATGSINRLFKKAAADYTAGKKAKGKLGPDEHYLFQRAEAASEMDAAALRGELAKLDALADDESLSDDQRALAVLERGIVVLVGDMKNADSGRLFTAFDELTRLYSQGVVAWKAKQTARREARQAVRDALKADAGKSGVLKERQAMEKAMTTLFGKAKSAWLSVSSFSEVLRYAFGSKSQQATELIDGEREASNAYEDEQQAIADELESLFASMAGGKTLDGERLRFDMAQRTIKAGDVELSQFEAITALLMWRQEDGRRHMEGTFDENGQRTSGWSYDQAWIDEVEKQLTPEGRRVMAWLAAKYGSEHGELNALYRERHGVNLPAHDNYAPLTVKPMQAKAGEIVDPVSGAAVSGSILTPGSLRTRSRMAIAEPEFRDALQTFVAHKKQMGYWKAYYDLATDMQAVLGNRELMNSVEAAAGKEAVVTLRKWMDVLAQGGVRDASAGLAMNDRFQRMMSRAATVGLLGRVSTLLVQSTQLAAASVQMPVGAYLRRFGKLLAGQLDWKGALQSDFIQRRIQTAPPIVRQAMENLGTATRPNLITRAVRNLGNLLSGADGLFTGGTYAILLDYHRETGRKLGLTGADLDEHAHREAERATEQVAQPTRTATRSLAEITATNPLAKVSFAYASEARQKIALLGWSMANFKADPVRFGKAAFLVFGVGGVMSQVLKNIWKEAKGDDDEEKWSPERLVRGSVANALHGIPMVSEMMNEPGMFSSTAWAKASVVDFMEGDWDLRDVNTLLGTLGLLNDTAAGVAALSNAGYDFAKIIEAAFSE